MRRAWSFRVYETHIGDDVGPFVIVKIHSLYREALIACYVH
jgi:hypothetical protein